MVDHLGTRGSSLSTHLSRIIMDVKYLFAPARSSTLQSSRMVYPRLKDLLKFYYPLPLSTEVLVVLPEASKDPLEDLDQFGLIGRKHWNGAVHRLRGPLDRSHRHQGISGPGVARNRTIATNTVSPEGRLKTLDLWAKISTDRDSEWEEAEDI
ncbi:hypothetical protein BHM03_00031502 [Ensete ventricosum]|uniref:Uncharacterized protein n=1 Tax=Ensete ventricosum TaxID=4639 RepID=A0A445MIE5_ENSVE|nr:hypothetical protein BHM03_00031502 [Ensete ventricosum]